MPQLLRPISPSPRNTPPVSKIPTIRLTHATPSTASPHPDETLLSPYSIAPISPESPRRGVVPKKSKLSLLTGSRREREFSDITRRIGAPATTSGVDIYVDPSQDPDIGEIVVVKKKKSRAKLDGIRWALGEKTNSNAYGKEEKDKDKKKDKLKDENAKPKTKNEEKDKWWTIGRGRKDSKEKAKEKARPISPVPGMIMGGLPTPPPSGRPKVPQRSSSLSSGVILSNIDRKAAPPQPSPTPAPRPNTPMLLQPGSRAPTPALVVPMPDSDEKGTKGSLAVRAMRSVRSLARIGSWAQLKNGNGNEKEKTRRGKESNDSSSSWEAGEVSVVRSFVPGSGLDGTVRSGMTGVSYASSGSSDRLSATSLQSNSRPPNANRLSTLSTASSLAPVSTYSCDSRASTYSSDSQPPTRRSSVQSQEPEIMQGKRSSRTSSIKWEDNLETIKEKRRGAKERRGGAIVAVRSKDSQRSSQRSSEGRQRGRLSTLFPDVIHPPAIVMDEAASDASHQTTPPKPIPRQRPVSEQLLNVRPKGIVAIENGDPAISVLHAATSDLASLISRLDLQATPDGASPFQRSIFASRDNTTTYGTPLRQGGIINSPTKKSPKENPSITSLRPYSKSRDSASSNNTNSTYGPVFSLPNQPIEIDSPPKSTLASTTAPGSDIPSWVFRTNPNQPSLSPKSGSPALRPAPSRSRFNLRPKESKVNLTRACSRAFGINDLQEPVAPATLAPQNEPDLVSSIGTGTTEDSDAFLPGHSYSSSETSAPHSLPPAIKSRAEILKEIGYNGTFGDFGADDEVSDEPDSDIPDELQKILSGKESLQSLLSVDDTLSMQKESPVGRAFGSPSDLSIKHERSASVKASPSPGLPPAIPLPSPTSHVPADSLAPPPVFRAFLVDDQAREAVLTGSEPSSPRSSPDGDTKKSFDFTGTLNKLNESGDANRQSFIEQLENAFNTSAKLDSFDFDRKFTVPSFDPKEFVKSLDFPIKPSANHNSSAMESMEATKFEDIIPVPSLVWHVSQPVLTEAESEYDSVTSPLIMHDVPEPIIQRRESLASLASDGQLNTSFKFGGLSSLAGPTVLSDAHLPALPRVRCISESIIEEDSSVLKSIYGQAVALPQMLPEPSRNLRRVASDTSSKRMARENATATSHRRSSSQLSFQGLDSFLATRNVFEFPDNRPSYFPTSNSGRPRHAKQESVFSIASVSSYGRIIKDGARDPFNYSYHSRPPSEDMTQSVNDTFSFLKQDPHHKRLSMDSDISSFYFRPGPAFRRGHRANDSIASVMSGNAPPISIYNRSYGHSLSHSRPDSWASGSSLAHAYGAQGAAGGRAAWARHRRDESVDTDPTEFSAKRLGRPGLGDKMLQSTMEPNGALTSISASPPESVRGDQLGEKSSFDSLLDERRTSVDSIFDKTGNRSSVSSDSIFGHDHYQRRPPVQSNQFRPVSLLSVASIESPKDDDTMLTMLNGDHVRRKSIGSSFEASPCVRIEKQRVQERPALIRQDSLDVTPEDSILLGRANKSQLIGAPSIQFGTSRMNLARQGVLQRQSLEESCLIAEREDFAGSAHYDAPVISIVEQHRATSRPSSYHSESSRSATPPLCVSDGSQSGGSQSSLDLAHLDDILTSATRPTSTTGRLRARGQGHRRQQSQISRTSVYSTVIDTIQEEPIRGQQALSPALMSFGAGFESLTVSEKQGMDHSVVMIVDGEDDETGPVLRRYWALRSEADETVAQSKIVWQDTPFSLFAVQSFYPPNEPEAMKAMLEHSQMMYGPLPLELRVRKVRSRTSSRASPYPQRPRHTPTRHNMRSPETKVLHNVPIDPNSPAPTLATLKPLTPLNLDFKKPARENNGKSVTRQRVGSGARRAALGWSKRKTPKASEKSFANKENDVSGIILSPTDSLRIVRPRPRGRVR